MMADQFPECLVTHLRTNFRIRSIHARLPLATILVFDIIIALMQGGGRLGDNKMPSAVPESFMWSCKDESERSCELVVKFESIEGNPNELILVISAFREVKK